MSDFVSDFWHYFVAITIVLSVFGCLVLLWISGTTKAATTEDNTTGHVWDVDLKELNNPLPKWWVYLFIITCIFALVYGGIYPMLGQYQGAANWSSANDLKKEVQKMDQDIQKVYAPFEGKKTDQLMQDPKAMQIGERLFMNYCAQCHGSDARGSLHFPNLTDKDWLGGSDAAYITKTITEGRKGVMPPQIQAVGSPDDVKNLAHYVLSLSNNPHDKLRATLGKSKFAACAACHGNDGKGNQTVGAPNLTDDIWLHGWGEEAIIRAITNGFNNHMPPQSSLLNESQIRVLTAYVMQFSAKPSK